MQAQGEGRSIAASDDWLSPQTRAPEQAIGNVTSRLPQYKKSGTPQGWPPQ